MSRRRLLTNLPKILEIDMIRVIPRIAVLPQYVDFLDTETERIHDENSVSIYTITFCESSKYLQSKKSDFGKLVKAKRRISATLSP